MTKEITISDPKTSIIDETIKTDGYILCYTDDTGNIKFTGKMNLKSLAPVLMKFAMERMTKNDNSEKD